MAEIPRFDFKSQGPEVCAQIPRSWEKFQGVAALFAMQRKETRSPMAGSVVQNCINRVSDLHSVWLTWVLINTAHRFIDMLLCIWRRCSKIHVDAAAPTIMLT